MSIRPFLFFSFITVISSCKKVSNFPVPEVPNKPVLNLLMNKDSLMTARLTWSAKLSELQVMRDIPDAVIRLYENDALKETFTKNVNDKGRIDYRSNTVPRAGSRYRVTATIPDYEEVSRSDEIPDTVKVGEMRMTLVQVNSYDSRVTVTVRLHDDPAVKNYYLIRLYYKYEWAGGPGTNNQQKMRLSFEAESADVDLFGNREDGTSFYTTDALFNGRSPRFTFKPTVFNTRNIIIEITALTYNSYNYLSSAYRAQEYNNDILSEKVIVHNNILNGLGIVGGVAQREYELVR